jgi:hypothetical protein
MWDPRMRGSLQADHDPPGPADHDRLGRYAGTALRAEGAAAEQGLGGLNLNQNTTVARAQVDVPITILRRLKRLACPAKARALG